MLKTGINNLLFNESMTGYKKNYSLPPMTVKPCRIWNTIQIRIPYQKNLKNHFERVDVSFC